MVSLLDCAHPPDFVPDVANGFAAAMLCSPRSRQRSVVFGVASVADSASVVVAFRIGWCSLAVLLKSSGIVSFLDSDWHEMIVKIRISDTIKVRIFENLK